ncbi:MAG: DUF4440 domain-containing protein [Candidatus Obscuribacterales bacterium]|nr:DUF4440 domain-containing protein [Candidatus Obscuribacterales bacterium]
MDESTALKSEFAKQAADYEKLFETGNAGALAELWTPDGTLETGDGKVCKGRAEIKQYFENSFKKYGPRKLRVQIDSLRSPDAGIAIEEGITTIPNSTSSKYMVLHVKKDDGWKMAWVVESNEDRAGLKLSDIDWIKGKWKASTKSGIDLTIEAKLIEKEHFIECTTSNAEKTKEARQIIGYNPLLGSLISWHFAGEGGFGRGVWSRIANGWRQDTTGILPNGDITSASYTITKRNNDTFTWQSTERSIGGVRLPDSGLVVLNRVAE